MKSIVQGVFALIVMCFAAQGYAQTIPQTPGSPAGVIRDTIVPPTDPIRPDQPMSDPYPPGQQTPRGTQKGIDPVRTVPDTTGRWRMNPGGGVQDTLPGNWRRDQLRRDTMGIDTPRTQEGMNRTSPTDPNRIRTNDGKQQNNPKGKSGTGKDTGTKGNRN